MFLEFLKGLVAKEKQTYILWNIISLSKNHIILVSGNHCKILTTLGCQDKLISFLAYHPVPVCPRLPSQSPNLK